MSEHDLLISGYFEDLLTDEQFTQLVTWLNEDRENARYFAREAVLRRQMRENLRWDDMNSFAQASDTDPLRADDTDNETLSLMRDVLEQEHQASLRRAHQIAEAQSDRQRVQNERANALTLLQGTGYDSTPVRHIVIPKAVVYAAVAAMLLLVAYVFTLNQSTPVPPPDDLAINTAPVQLPVLAEIKASLDAAWLEDALPTHEGGKLHRGTHTLTKGIVQLEFEDGAVTIIEAPAVFTLETESSMRLTAGKLSANVSARAVGFTVRAPRGRIVDLGTQFGVAVDPAQGGQTDVHVFDGMVVVNGDQPSGQPAATQTLVANTATRINANGTFAPLASDAIAFVRADEFEARRLARQGSAYHRWLAHSYEVRRDPSLVAYYTFEQAEDERYRLMNFADDSNAYWGHLGVPGEPGTAPTWVAGRWKQKGALRFEAVRHQRVVVPDWHAANVDTELTIAGWYRMDSTHGWHLLATQWNDETSQFAFHLGIIGDFPAPDRRPGPHLQLHLRSSNDQDHGLHVKDEQRAGTRTAPEDGWVHFAVTVASNGGPVRLYKNGREIDVNGATYDAPRLPDIREPLVLGSKAVLENPPYPISHFCDGTMDELALFRRALTPREIRHMYEQGRPND